jgi:hypothetical protein
MIDNHSCVYSKTLSKTKNRQLSKSVAKYDPRAMQLSNRKREKKKRKIRDRKERKRKKRKKRVNIKRMN